METNDRRIEKTRNSIKRAFIDLLAVKNFNDIKIKDIADEANITRKTFYMHYDGIHNLVSKMKEDISNIVQESFKDINSESDMSNPIIIFNKIANPFLHQEIDYVKIFMNKENIEFNYNLLELFVDNFLILYKDKLKKPYDNRIIETIKSYIISGFLYSYSKRSDDLEPLSTDEFLSTLAYFITNGINGFTK